MKFKVTGGVNTIGAPSLPNTNLAGARGSSHYGSMLSPISGSLPPDRSIRLPPPIATRITNMVNPDHAQIRTHKTERNEK